MKRANESDEGSQKEKNNRAQSGMKDAGRGSKREDTMVWSGTDIDVFVEERMWG